MESGYKILWTEHALSKLANTYDYLELHFSEREINKLSVEIDRVLHLISLNPNLLPLSDKKDFRRAALFKYNTIYYKVEDNAVIILSFFANRRNPKSRKI